MKHVFSGCALTILALGLAGQARAQVEVKPAPIHAVPADPDGAQGALIAGPPPSVAAEPAQLASAQPSPQPTSVQAEMRAQAQALGLAPPEPKAPDEAKARETFAVAALTQPVPPPEPVLSPQESAFFVVLGKRVTDAASAYEDYVRDASAIDAKFSGAEQVQTALGVAERYNAVQLQEGAIAYAAVLALRSQAFVDGVRAHADPALADRLIADPQTVLSLPGSADAVLDVSNVLRVQAQGVLDAGGVISKAAYAVQREPWSRGAVAEPDKVLALAKVSAARLMVADIKAERRLLDSIGAAPQNLDGRPMPSPEVTRGLALAAIAILGQAGDVRESRFQPLLRELSNADCLQLAKMDLNQCLAVAGPQYEDVFCLGQHAVGETGKCLVSAAGEPVGGDVGLKTAALDAEASERAEAYGRPGN